MVGLCTSVRCGILVKQCKYYEIMIVKEVIRTMIEIHVRYKFRGIQRKISSISNIDRNVVEQTDGCVT